MFCSQLVIKSPFPNRVFMDPPPDKMNPDPTACLDSGYPVLNIKT